jgi:hypothetical protein
MEPVFAVAIIARTALSATVSGTTTKIKTLGIKSIYSVFTASIDFCVAFLSPKTLYVHRRHTLDSDFGKSVFDLFKPERLNDRFNFFHVLVCGGPF